MLVSFTDITEQHNAHQRLAYQATHDLVTGLPNRAHILTLISEAIASDEHRLGAVLFIDMDKFKSVNDALGHHAGDTVLQIAAQRLVIPRESDCARTVCAQITASIGVVTVRADDHRDAVEILRDADLAMYQAKTTGRATSHFNECDRRLSPG